MHHDWPNWMWYRREYNNDNVNCSSRKKQLPRTVFRSNRTNRLIHHKRITSIRTQFLLLAFRHSQSNCLSVNSYHLTSLQWCESSPPLRIIQSIASSGGDLGNNGQMSRVEVSSLTSILDPVAYKYSHDHLCISNSSEYLLAPRTSSNCLPQIHYLKIPKV